MHRASFAGFMHNPCGMLFCIAFFPLLNAKPHTPSQNLQGPAQPNLPVHLFGEYQRFLEKQEQCVLNPSTSGATVNSCRITKTTPSFSSFYVAG
jgi:hypothetical protein